MAEGHSASGIEIASPAPIRDPGWLAPVARISSALNLLAALFAAVLLAGMVLYVLVEIGMRAFSLSTFMLDTLVGHGVAAVTFLAMPFTLERGGMIRVGFFIKTGRPPARWALEFWSTLAGLVFLAFIFRYQWTTVAKDFTRGTRTEHMVAIPNWIPGSVLLAGLALTILYLLVRLLRQLAIGTPSDPIEADPFD